MPSYKVKVFGPTMEMSWQILFFTRPGLISEESGLKPIKRRRFDI